MKQQILASQAVFEKYGRKSRRELFLDEMEKIVPRSTLEALVRPHYAKADNGHQSVGLSIMLRTYFVQQWFNLSDPGAEELLYESSPVRWFGGVDLGMAAAQDETTICRFRHLLEKHDLGGLMLDAVNVHLEAKGIKIATGTIVDATIIHAPSSTKNAKKEREINLLPRNTGTAPLEEFALDDWRMETAMLAKHGISLVLPLLVRDGDALANRFYVLSRDGSELEHLAELSKEVGPAEESRTEEGHLLTGGQIDSSRMARMAPPSDGT